MNINDIRRERDSILNRLDNATDNNMIDSCIYRLKAIDRELMLLYKNTKPALNERKSFWGRFRHLKNR